MHKILFLDSAYFSNAFAYLLASVTGFIAAEVGVMFLDLFDILGFIKIQDRLFKLLVGAAEYAGPCLDGGICASVVVHVVIEVGAIEEAWFFCK